ncbi:MAG TPA: 2-C-methyl-D-erythritol 4-phosphate cytidylyltransferase [Acidimicrobiales bacterium]|nr:2-C-methyl-D-erythritol 4-phosphate cytidylyltransferase [Acidimicrobiales bacterium]
MAPTVWCVVVAAGSGARFGGPKQFETLGDRRVLDWAVGDARSVTGSEGCGVVVVVPADRVGAGMPGVTVVAGGDTRSASVRAGLAVVPATADIVVVHDAARPFAGAALFDSVVQAVAGGADAAVPGVAVADTLKRVEGGEVVETIDRAAVVAVQTPQAFRAEVLRRAHEGAPDATDDAALVEAAGGRVQVVAGSADNFKITTPDDLERARRARSPATGA